MLLKCKCDWFDITAYIILTCTVPLGTWEWSFLFTDGKVCGKYFPLFYTQRAYKLLKKHHLSSYVHANQLLVLLPFSELFWITKPINLILPFKMQVQIYTQCRHSSTFNRLNSTNLTNIIPVANEKCIQQFSSAVENMMLCLQNPIITYSCSENYLTILKSS